MSNQVLAVETEPGAYAERARLSLGTLDQAAVSAVGPLVRAWQGRKARADAFVRLIAERGRALAGLKEAGLREQAAMLRTTLRREGLRDDLVAWSFALVREVAGPTVGLRHFDVQLLGGWALLHGMVAEMDTGEGKTLTATLPACTLALAGVPVHIITVNDYLASRDADWMGPIYRALGLAVGVVVHGLDPAARRQAYAADVTYCANKEIVFDYLKDRMALGPRPSPAHLQLERLRGESSRSQKLFLRGLHYAIVDEADSVLVDEARVPLIISSTEVNKLEHSVYATALSLAGQLQPEVDFLVSPGDRQVRLTEDGTAKLEELAAPLGGLWTGRLRREELVQQALTARHVFVRDRDYLVKDGKIQLVDEFSGRVLADRSWERGLHQMVEAKEGVSLTSQQGARARITYQRFFRKYLRLAGMTGTAREVRGELWSIYRLTVVRIPTNRSSRRRGVPDRAFLSARTKWDAVVARIAEIHGQGRPILVGTRSVAVSEHLSRLLGERGLPHQVLNARQDRDEAAIIAQAGQPGRITVATNMAGRGTDIRLGAGVVELGGLHVIATERHESGRIDRQLFGRCGRQGDPGSYEAITALDDELIATYGRGIWRWLASLAAKAGHPVPRWIARLAVRKAQRTAERINSRIRRDLLRADEQMETALAFSGQAE